MANEQQGNTSHDNAIGWGILLAIVACLMWVLWFFFEYEIKDLYRWWRWSEIWLISQVTGGNFAVERGGELYRFDSVLQFAGNVGKGDLDSSTLGFISYMAMEPLKIPFMIVLGAMGMWALLWGPNNQYRRKLNLDGLIGTQAANFPVISPFVKFNPANMPPRAPGMPVPVELTAFSEALGPEEWIAYNEIPIPDGQLDEKATYVAFARQLGPRWQGAMRLAPYKQVLLAAFCLKAKRKRDESDDMLSRIAQCWSHDKGLRLKKDPKLLKKARAVLKNKDIAGQTLALCNQHAFQTCALMRALLNARDEGGVLAPAQFVWLRAHDRTLWYPLNNLGRQSFHMEAMGAMAHFKSERRTQRPIPKPKVMEAVDSIRGYMTSARARPVPALDYSGSKRRGIKKPKAGIKKPKKKKKT